MKRFLALFLSVLLALPMGTLGAFADTDFSDGTSGQSGDIGLDEVAVETTAVTDMEEPDETDVPMTEAPMADETDASLTEAPKLEETDVAVTDVAVTTASLFSMEPVPTSTVKVYTAHDKNEAGDIVATIYGGATPDNPVKTSTNWDYAKALITKGGTFVMVGKGYFNVATVFEATPAPIVFTGVDGDVSYISRNEDGSIKYATETMGNIGQYGMFMINASLTIEFLGDVIFDNTVLLSRLSEDGYVNRGLHQGTISVTNGGKLVIKDNVEFLYMGSGKNFDLNVGDGSYAFLHKIGFDKYTGTGTIVLGDEVRGKIDANTFAGFKGQVLYGDGSNALEGLGEPDIEPEPEVGNIEYSYADGTLTISGTGPMDNYADSTYVPWYSYRDQIRSVIIGSGVTSIGAHAFYACNNLESISIPDGVKSIGSKAFAYCNRLTGITIPDSVKTIGGYAFYYCYSLTSIKIPYGVTMIYLETFRGCSSLASVSIPDSVTAIGSYAFSGCRSLLSVSIPDGVKSIGKEVFYNCRSLTEISIPDSVTSIGQETFCHCTGLRSVKFSGSVTQIGAYMFYDCPKLESIVVPDGVTSIGGYAFYGCYALNSAVLPVGLTSIGQWAFAYCDSLGDITIPSTVTSIGDYAFIDCVSITTIEIPSGVTSIGANVFQTCFSLKSVVMHDGLTSIGSYAFACCDNLSDITIPSTVTSIGEYAFIDCANITAITIPDGVTSIGAGAFFNCKGLESIVIPDQVKVIDEYTFYGCTALKSITIASSVISIAPSALDGCYNATIITSSGSYAHLYAQGRGISYSINDEPAAAVYNVIYVKQGAGGDGSAPDNALSTLYEANVAAANSPVDAVIKFVGSVTVDLSAFTDLFYYEPVHSNKITWTGYDADSKLVFKTMPDNVNDSASYYVMGGELCIKDLSIEIDGGKVQCIITDLYDITVDTGVSVTNIAGYPIETLTVYGVLKKTYSYNLNYVSSDRVHKASPNITLKSGSFKQVVGYMANSSNKIESTKLDGKVTIKVSGNTFINQLYAVCNAYCTVVDCDIILDGGVIGRYAGAVDRKYSAGMLKYGVAGVTGNYTLYLTSNFDLSKQTALIGSEDSTSEFMFALCGSTVNKDYSGALDNDGMGTYTLVSDAQIYDEVKSETVKINQATFDYILKSKDGAIIPSEIASGKSDDGLSWIVYDTGALVISGNGAMQDYEASDAMPWNNYKSMIRSVVIEEGVSSVGARAFFGCQNIENVVLACTITSIGDHAFRECMNIRSVNIPEGVRTIGDYAFRYCTSLESIDIPSSVTSIGMYAFYYCTSLMQVSMDIGLECIGDNAFYYCISLNKLVLPVSVRTIGDYAFYECISLDSVQLGVDGLYSIGSNAFHGCSALYSVVIPDSVSFIGVSAFEDCAGLSQVVIGSGTQTIGAYAFYNCSSLTSVDLRSTELTTVGCDVFYGCGSLKYNQYDNAYYLGSYSDPYLLLVRATSTDIDACTIHTSTRVIGANAFSSCYAVTELYIPDSVRAINGGAFAGMNSLAKLDLPFAGYGEDGQENLLYLFSYDKNGKASSGEIPLSLDSVTVRGGYVVDNFLYNCRSVSTVELGEGVSGIGSYAFSYCYALDSISIPSSVSSIGSYAFTYTSIREIVIPENVHSVGSYAFGDCSVLERVTIENGVSEIGGYAFVRCEALTEIIIPDSVVDLGVYAFSGAYKLERVVLGNGLNAINDGTFVECASLKTIEFSDSLVNIGNNAFEGCYNLDSVALPIRLASIGYGAFSECRSLKSIDIPASVGYIGDNAFYYCKSLSEVKIAANIQEIGEKTFYECSSLTTVTLPQGLERIKRFAFAGCKALDHIDIPSNVLDIEMGAFQSCIALKQVDFSLSLRVIGYGAFANCISLESVDLPDTVNYIGVRAFSACISLGSITLSSSLSGIEAYTFAGCSSLKRVVLPSSVMYINQRAFVDCSSLEYIVIPNSVSRIETGAFYGCESLAEIKLHRGLSNIAKGILGGCNALKRIELPYSFGFAFKELFSEVVLEMGVSTTTTTDNTVTPDAYIPDSLEEIVFLGGNIEAGYLDGCDNVQSVVLKLEGEQAYVNDSRITSYEGYGAVIIGDDIVGSVEQQRFDNFSGAVMDDDGNNPFYATWSYDEDTATLTFSGNGRMENLDQENLWRSLSGSVKHIVIEEGITSIMMSAFENFTVLESVSIASSVTVIGYGAFYNCSSLTSIDLPPRLNSIGMQAFYNCSSLVSIVIPDSVIRLDNDAFMNCYGLKSAHIGSGLVRIENSAFENCINLSTVHISDGVEVIGWTAFLNCINLKSIRIPNTIMRIDGGAFAGCDLLTYYEYNGGNYLGNETNNYVVLSALYNSTLDIHPDTRIIGQGAIRCNPEQTEIVIPEGIVAIGVGAMSSLNATKITLPSTVSSIGVNAFSYCYDLEEIVIPNSVTYVDNCIFAECSSLESITMPYAVTDRFAALFGESEFPGGVCVQCGVGYDGEIRSYYVPQSLCTVNITGGEIHERAFDGMTMISNVSVSGIESIPSYAFAEFASMTNVALSTDIVSIGDHAFENCTGISSITLPEGLCEIGEYAFAGCTYITNITVPSMVTEIKEGTFTGCRRLLYVTLPSELRNIEDKALLDCWLLREIELPYGTEYIGSEAFANCTRLKHVIIPDSVTHLGSYAFSGCSRLIDVYMSRGVTELEEMLFYGCDKLEKLVINAPVTSIDLLALYGADNLTVHCIEDEYMTEFFLDSEIPFEIVSAETSVYLVLFYDRFGEIVDYHSYKAGDSIVAPSYSDSYSDDEGVYIFAGWNNGEICTGYAEYYPQYTMSYMYGDADGDLELSNADITFLVRAAAGWENDVILDVLDIDRNGIFNNRDVIYLIKKLAWLV